MSLRRPDSLLLMFIIDVMIGSLLNTLLLVSTIELKMPESCLIEVLLDSIET